MQGNAPPPLQPSSHMLIVIHGLHICGAARHCLELLAAMNAASVYTTVLAPYGGGHWADLFFGYANDMYIYTAPSHDGSELDSITWRSPRKIISAHYDYAIAWALTKPRKLESYAHFHTEPEFGFLTRLTLLAAGEQCRKIFFPSHETRLAYQALVQPQPAWWKSKAQILPNAMTVTAGLGSSSPASSWGDDSPRSLQIGVVSRLDPEKLSIPLLLGTLDELDKQNINFRMRLAGYGIIGDEVTRLLRNSQWADKVDILGWVSDIVQIYDKSDLIFLPSRSETMPYAAMEAVQAGKPVVLPSLGYFATRYDMNPLIHTFTAENAAEAAAVIAKVVRTPSTAELADNTFSVSRWRENVALMYNIQPGDSR